jgi:hypothetical protein
LAYFAGSIGLPTDTPIVRLVGGMNIGEGNGSFDVRGQAAAAIPTV